MDEEKELSIKTIVLKNEITVLELEKLKLKLYNNWTIQFVYLSIQVQNRNFQQWKGQKA
jgi:hypothetical protein